MNTIQSERTEILLKIVSAVTRIPVCEIKGNCRNRNIVDARHLSFYLIKKHIENISLKAIGRELNRDHSSIINGIRKAKDIIETEPTVKSIVEEIENRMPRFWSKFKDSGISPYVFPGLKIETTFIED